MAASPAQWLKVLWFILIAFPEACRRLRQIALRVVIHRLVMVAIHGIAFQRILNPFMPNLCIFGKQFAAPKAALMDGRRYASRSTPSERVEHQVSRIC